MQITSNGVGGSARLLSDAGHAEQAQHDATNSSPVSTLLRQGIIIVGGAPAQAEKASSSAARPESTATMASLVPTGGLHPVSLGLKDLLGGRLDRVALNPQPLPPKATSESSHISKPAVRDLMPAHHFDNMSEMGEMQSFRLQMAMDMLSKMMSTLSNLLQKQSQTADAITHNIK